jgi:hypothetical protein
MRDPPGKHFLDQYLHNLELSHIKTKWHTKKKNPENYFYCTSNLALKMKNR